MVELSEGRGAMPVDAVTRLFVLAMSAVTLAVASRVAAWPLLLANNALVLGLVALLARAPRSSRLAALVALGYPLLLIPAYYGQLGVTGLGVAHVRDPVVQAWEAALFGGQPSVSWHQAMPDPPLSFILHACYAADYVIVGAVPLWLFVRAEREACGRAVFALALTFYVCYVASAIFPVAGPYYYFPKPTGPAVSVAPARLVYALLGAGSSYGTAFPSSHVAGSWCAVLVGFKYARPLGLALAPVALGLAAGTVYGQFHYVVDALAGAAVAVACFLLADPLRTRLARP